MKICVSVSQKIMNLIDSIKASSGFSESTVKALLASLSCCIATSLRNGEEVSIAELGVFKFTDKPERLGHNPKTGEKQTFPATRSVRLKLSAKFKALVQPDPSMQAEAETEAETEAEVDGEHEEEVSKSKAKSKKSGKPDDELPPIPPELLEPQEKDWKIKTPTGITQVKTSELVGYGVNEQTPIFSVSENTWVLAGKDPEVQKELAKSSPKTKAKDKAKVSA